MFLSQSLILSCPVCSMPSFGLSVDVSLHFPPHLFQLLTDPQRTKHQFCRSLLNPCPLPPPTTMGTVSLPGSVEPMNAITYFSKGHSSGSEEETKWKSFSVSLLVRHTRYALVAGSRLVSGASDAWLWACNGSSEWSVSPSISFSLCVCVCVCVCVSVCVFCVPL